jgi:lipid A 3-O-deacylase
MTIRIEKKTRRTGLKFASRSFLILLVAAATLHFSTKSMVAEEAIQPQQGESGLSKHPWQIGLFVQGGFPPSSRINTQIDPYHADYMDIKLQLFSAGFEAGKQTRRFEGPMPLRGRGEAMLEVMPFWLARYPSQTIAIYNNSGQLLTAPFPWNGHDIHGASITPFLLRWNFSQRDSARIVPWAQFGGGLLWTNHQFPLHFYPSTIIFDGNTSVINFTPQMGAGVNIFNRPRNSINLAMKAIHYSNAGLGDYNPGVKLTFQFSAGYSWWR